MSDDPIAERITLILWEAKNNSRAQAIPEADRLAWARDQAERDYEAARRKAANRAQRDRQRAEHDAAIADLSSTAGLSPADAAEAIKRHKKTERLEAIARAEALLAGESAHQGASTPEAAHDPKTRTRGRSRWTNDLFAARWAAACERAGQPYTYSHVAPEFEWLDGTTRLDADPDYLGKLWRDHGRPDPTP